MKDLAKATESLIEPLDPAAQEKIRRLAEQTAQLFAEGVPKNTARTYASYWKLWCEHCASIGVSPLPAEPVVVVTWVTALVTAGKTMSTVYVALSAVRAEHQRQGHPTPTDDPMVKTVLDKARKAKGRPARPKKALRLADLRMVMAKIPRDEEGQRDAALLLLGWYGAFRRSELCGLRWSDLDFGDREGLSVTLRRSKTDQGGEGKTKGVPYQSDPDLCPVRAVLRWKQLVELRGQGGLEQPVFQKVRMGGVIDGQPLSGQDVAKAVKRAVVRANFDPKIFAGHSLRRGFATEAARAGRKLEDIKKHLLHTSIETTAKYVEEGTRFGDSNPARGLS